MKVNIGGNLGSSRKYSKKLFGHMFYSWCSCPLSIATDLVLILAGARKKKKIASDVGAALTNLSGSSHGANSPSSS